MREWLTVAMTALAAWQCTQGAPVEATREHASVAAANCQIERWHFGYWYCLDGDELPDNAIWLPDLTDGEFNEAARCLKANLARQGVRASVFGEANETQRSF